MPTLHLVSHTHWDREWYLTFQQFRIKLIHLLDGLLDILATHANYRHFMLDGQTIVLDDYLAIRPEREAELRAHIQSGRILIGPWYILPDEFLVSPEATLRNLLEGERLAQGFGAKMNVGYIPDPFGHIGQMPQILRGFGIESACVQRGLDDQSCEFWWQAPDGSRVFMAYLRDGYGNAAGLPTADPAQFAAEVCRLCDSLAAHAASDHLLLMHGTDHQKPTADTTAAIAYANAHLNDCQLTHSTLPAYLAAAQAQLAAQPDALPIVTGELRSPKRFHLLPGVLSTRMWIKQRNQACETLLEKWAEPFSLWASQTTDDRRPLTANRQPSSVIRHAWRLLLECHPHDSICGCSIDQVHAEMRPRFDQVEQIGEEITCQSLAALAALANTRPPENIGGLHSAVVVFNPTAGPRHDLACFEVEPGPDHDDVEILDEAGNVLPHQLDGLGSRELFNVATDRKGLEDATRMIKDGRIAGMVARDFSYHRDGNTLHIEVILATSGEPDLARWEEARKTLLELTADPTLTVFAARGRSAAACRVCFAARGVPGWGYRTFWVRGVTKGSPSAPLKISPLLRALLPLAEKLARLPLLRRLFAPPAQPKSSPAPHIIENEFLRVEAASDGTLTVFDKATGATFSGLNRFVDGGDCGDEYNYSPPENDRLIENASVRWVRLDPEGEPGAAAARQTLEIGLALRVPRRLNADRAGRDSEMTSIPIVVRASLAAGVPRVDIGTTLDNTAEDHRLRAHFPAPFAVNAADYDGHFEVVRRPLGTPAYDATWAEQPRPEAPQRAFTAIGNGQIGLLLANRGLPEVEARRTGEDATEIALTLLRCVGWLSRDDFSTRRSHAGPHIATPEAQLLGKHSFEYAVIPYGDDPRPAYQQAEAFQAPLRAVAEPIHNGAIPAQAAILQVSAPDFVVSAIKSSEDGAGWIVRGYNRGDMLLETILTPWRRFRRVELINLAETPLQTLAPAADGSVTVKVAARQIVSVKLSDISDDA